MDACPSPTQRSARRDPEQLLGAARAGERGAIGRLLSLVERGGEAARAVGRATFAPSASVEHVIGVTGSPGAGKSTLVDRLIAAVRAGGDTVGVLAVDPSSPYSGGAILGDRIRMQDHALDRGVFIRSMASRGHQGGLALAAPEAIRVLAAVGMPVVLVETVGVGQVEVEIAGAADTTVVVVTPGWGDAVQASKAGLLEVADVFVVNKADREGAAETRRDLEAMLEMAASFPGAARSPATSTVGGLSDPVAWRPPVLLATATTGEGTDAVWSAVTAHRAHLVAAGELERRREQRLIAEMERVMIGRLARDVRELEGGARFEEVRAELLARRVDPYEAAARLLDR